MADNFLKRQMADYQASRQAAEKARRLKWQKQLKAYKEKLARERRQHEDNTNA